jgi:hypothetical protein
VLNGFMLDSRLSEVSFDVLSYALRCSRHLMWAGKPRATEVATDRYALSVFEFDEYDERLSTIAAVVSLCQVAKSHFEPAPCAIGFSLMFCDRFLQE